MAARAGVPGGESRKVSFPRSVAPESGRGFSGEGRRGRSRSRGTISQLIQGNDGLVQERQWATELGMELHREALHMPKEFVIFAGTANPKLAVAITAELEWFRVPVRSTASRTESRKESLDHRYRCGSPEGLAPLEDYFDCPCHRRGAQTARGTSLFG